MGSKEVSTPKSAPSSISGSKPPALPFMEWPLIGFVLAAIAGLMNSFTLIFAGTFATVQSGNVASSGIYLSTQDGPKWIFAIVSVFAFGLGSFSGGILMTLIKKKGKQYSVAMLTILGVLAAILSLIVVFSGFKEYHWIAYGVSFIAGAMGNAYHKDNNALYGAVAVTFVVQMAFNFLAQSLFAKKGLDGQSNLKWSGVFFSVLLGFASGGALGAWLIVLMGTDPTGFMGESGPAHLEPNGGWVLMLVAALFFLLALISGKRIQEHESADPTPGGYMG